MSPGWGSARSAPRSREWLGLADTAAQAAPALDAWLLGRWPVADVGYDRFREALRLLDDSSVLRPEQLARLLGCDVRTLQRLFRRFAGVGPKWLLTRARVSDAVALLDRGYDGGLADLANELGWFDQAHFTRDFHRITGETPAAYAARRPVRSGV